MSPAETPLQILVVSGSLREASYNGRLARLAAQLAEDAGAHATVYSALRDVEPFDEDLEALGTPPGAAAFLDAVRNADAVLVATPEYNASIPGQLKNAFDWASRSQTAPYGSLPDSAMFGTPVAVVSASTGQFGGVWARDELLKALRTQGARVVQEPAVAVPDAANAWDEAGALRSSDTTERLTTLVRALLDSARAVRAARSTDLTAAAS